MAAANTDKLRKLSRKWVGQIGSGGVNDASTTTIPLSSTTNLATDTAVTLVIDRVDSSGTKTPSLEETIVGVVSGSNIVNCLRGVEGTAQAHLAGAVVEVLVTADGYNDIIDHLLVGHLQSGAHASGLVFQSPTLSNPTMSGTVAGTHTYSGDVTFSGNVTGAGATFWAAVPGTPTRVSDTQFTITDTSNANLYDLLFKKGTVLKWLESTTFQTAMVISSSYGTDTVTINIVGDSLTAGFTAMKYSIPKALVETFIIAGTFPSAATTDISKTWYPTSGVYILSADLNVKTAGSGTGSNVVDINVSGSTKFTTKPTLTTGTSDLDNVADSPSTEVAAEAPVTIDVDSVTATTAPVDGYIRLYYYPSDWRYRS